MKSPQVEVNRATNVFEADCPDSVVDTLLVFPPKLEKGDKLPPLNVRLPGEPDPFLFDGKYNEQTDNLEFTFDGPVGFRYKMSLSIAPGANEQYTWKAKARGMTTSSNPTQGAVLHVPRKLCCENASMAEAKNDVLIHPTFLGETVQERFCTMRLKIKLFSESQPCSKIEDLDNGKAEKLQSDTDGGITVSAQVTKEGNMSEDNSGQSGVAVQENAQEKNLNKFDWVRKVLTTRYANDEITKTKSMELQNVPSPQAAELTSRGWEHLEISHDTKECPGSTSTGSIYEPVDDVLWQPMPCATQAGEDLQKQQVHGADQAGEDHQKQMTSTTEAGEDLHEGVHGADQVDGEMEKQVLRACQAGEDLQQQVHGADQVDGEMEKQVLRAFQAGEDLQQQVHGVDQADEDLQQQMASAHLVDEDLQKQVHNVGQADEDLQQQMTSAHLIDEDLQKQVHGVGQAGEDLQQQRQLLLEVKFLDDGPEQASEDHVPQSSPTTGGRKSHVISLEITESFEMTPPLGFRTKDAAQEVKPVTPTEHLERSTPSGETAQQTNEKEKDLAPQEAHKLAGSPPQDEGRGTCPEETMDEETAATGPAISTTGRTADDEQLHPPSRKVHTHSPKPWFLRKFEKYFVKK